MQIEKSAATQRKECELTTVVLIDLFIHYTIRYLKVHSTQVSASSEDQVCLILTVDAIPCDKKIHCAVPSVLYAWNHVLYGYALVSTHII